MIQRYLVLLFLLAITQFSHAQDFKQYIFKDKKVCAFSQPKDSIFLHVQPEVQKMFFVDGITAIHVTEACERDFFSPRIYYSVLEFEYTEDHALQAFDTLVIEAMKSHLSRLLDINKAGRIYGLSKTKKTLTLIAMNSCANYPDFKKVVETLRKQKHFDRILVVACGADSASAQVYW